MTSFVSAFEGHERVYASYVTFDPSDSSGLRAAVDWLDNEYVQQRYRGRVVTDFDEQVGHFSYAPFSLEKVMGLKLVGSEVTQIARVVGVDAEGILDLHRFVCIVKQLRSPEGNA